MCILAWILYPVFLLVLESSGISIIKASTPMHTALIFKVQAKVKGLREKRLSQPHYSIQHMERFLLLFYEKIHKFPNQ
jgi:hypothetical protein